MKPQPVIILDCETTGTDIARDQIIQLAWADWPGAQAPESRMFRPSVPIADEASEVHGFTDEDLVGCPTFGEHAAEIAAMLRAAEVVIGYNVTFDLEMLAAELGRCGYTWSPAEVTVIDAYRLWQRMEQRRLEDAIEQFLGEDPEGIHSATADVAYTGDVLRAMLERWNLASESWADLELVIDPERANWCGPSRHIQWQGDIPCVTFGKHAGAALMEVPVSYFRWMQRQDFPAHVREIAGKVCDLSPEKLLSWMRETYPPRGEEGEGDAGDAAERFKQLELT